MDRISLTHTPQPPIQAQPTSGGIDEIDHLIHLATHNLSITGQPLLDTRTQLFVGNLPYRVRWQDLKDLFRSPPSEVAPGIGSLGGVGQGQTGASQGTTNTVLRADVSLGPDNRSRGYGTVLLATREDAERAVKRLDGFVWMGRTLEVREDRLGVGGGGMGGVYPSEEYGYDYAMGGIGGMMGMGMGGMMGRENLPPPPLSQQPHSHPLALSHSSSHSQLRSPFSPIHSPSQAQAQAQNSATKSFLITNIPPLLTWQSLKDILRSPPFFITILKAEVPLSPAPAPATTAGSGEQLQQEEGTNLGYAIVCVPSGDEGKVWRVNGFELGNYALSVRALDDPPTQAQPQALTHTQSEPVPATQSMNPNMDLNRGVDEILARSLSNIGFGGENNNNNNQPQHNNLQQQRTPQRAFAPSPSFGGMFSPGSGPTRGGGIRSNLNLNPTEASSSILERRGNNLRIEALKLHASASEGGGVGIGKSPSPALSSGGGGSGGRMGVEQGVVGKPLVETVRDMIEHPHPPPPPGPLPLPQFHPLSPQTQPILSPYALGLPPLTPSMPSFQFASRPTFMSPGVSVGSYAVTPVLSWGAVGARQATQEERTVGYFDVPVGAGSGQGQTQTQSVPYAQSGGEYFAATGALGTEHHGLDPPEISPPSPRSSYTSSKTESVSGSGFGFDDAEGGRSSSLGTSVDGFDDIDDESLEAKNAAGLRMHSDPLIIPGAQVGGMHKRSKSTSASGSSSGDTDRPTAPSSSSVAINNPFSDSSPESEASPPALKKKPHPKFETSEFASIVSSTGTSQHLLGGVGLAGGTPGRRASWTPSTERPNFL